jgi:hypothetical protein
MAFASATTIASLVSNFYLPCTNVMETKELLFSADLESLESALRTNPALASEPIALPDNPAMAHPLHRVCDGVFSGAYTEDTALALARLFLQYGADVNYQQTSGKDSPLTAACSLHCDKLALLYLEHGARIDHRGCYGGTALHWAAWCGRDVVVKKLLEMKSPVNLLCHEFKSTPLFWTIHGYKFGGKENRHNHAECARMLLEHGADPDIPNFEGYRPIDLLGDDDTELVSLLER